MAEKTSYDVIIVGGGPAGLSAALTLYRQLHHVLVFDSHHPRNAWPLPTRVVHGWEGRQAGDLCAISRAELAATGLVTFADHKVETIDRIEDGFEVKDQQGEQWTGRKLLIATGKRNIFPPIPGFADNYPDRIFHCMFTFGYEHRGSEHAGLLGDGALSSPIHAAMVVGDAKKFAERITIYTNGDSGLKEKMMSHIHHSGVDFDDRHIVGIQRTKTGLELKMDGGRPEEMQFLVHQPSTEVSRPIIDQLGLQLDERGDIVSKPPFFQTDVPGVFVAGDCASPFKIIPMAMFSGANAGAGIARALAEDVLKAQGSAT